MRWGGTKSSATPKIVPKADVLAHVVRKITSRGVRERVRRNPKHSMRKIARNLKMDPKSMRTTVKTDLKLPPLKLKKCQHLTYCPSKTKKSWESWSPFEFAENWHAKGWNRFFRRKYVHCGDKVQSTTRQSAGQKLRGSSWRHVNPFLHMGHYSDPKFNHFFELKILFSTSINVIIAYWLL